MIDLTHEQIKTDLINDFLMDEEEAEFLATKSLSDINKTLQSVYQHELTSLSQPSTKTAWLINQLSSVDFKTEHLHLYELIDAGLSKYLTDNNITIENLNSLPLSENTIHHNATNISINGSDPLVKIISLSIQGILSDSDFHDDQDINNMLVDIDEQYHAENPQLSMQNNDLTDHDKNDLGIKVEVAGETIKNDPLSMSLNDPDFYDLFTNHPTPNDQSWNTILSDIKFQFDFNDTQMANLDTKLAIFSTICSSEENNPDWLAMAIQQRIEFCLEIFNSSSLTELDIQDSIEKNLAILREKTMGLTIKNNSGNNYENGFTTTLFDHNNEFVGNLQLFGENHEGGSFIQFKINKEYSELSLEKLLLLNTIWVSNLEQVNYDPSNEIINSSVATSLAKSLVNSELINYYNGCYFITTKGEDLLKERHFTKITETNTSPKKARLHKKASSNSAIQTQ